MVIHERFAIMLPKTYPLEKAGPIMCAGITMYDPMKHWGVKTGSRVGIVGLGGLGQIGIKLAKALGAIVTVVSRSEAKRDFAKKCGADNYVSAASAEQMTGASKTLDLILNTIPTGHDFTAYLPLLDQDGTLVMLGIAPEPQAVSAIPLIFSRTGIHGSLIGGIRNTQEVIDLCAKANIQMDTKVVSASEVNSIMEKLDTENDTGMRYVIDIETLKEDCGVAPPPKFQASAVPAARQTSEAGCSAGMMACFGSVVERFFAPLFLRATSKDAGLKKPATSAS
jgi:uncharacterized zinc-type alcohol dehydrogenase-like protein